MDYKVRAGGRSHKIEINETVQLGQDISVISDRQEVPVLLHEIGKEREVGLVAVDNKWYSTEIVRNPDGFPREIILNGVPYPVEIEKVESTRYKTSTQARKVDGKVHAILPGLIRNVLVEPGKQVTKGETILILEAMKMENEINSPIEGWVSSVEIKPGQVVSKGDLLVVVSETM